MAQILSQIKDFKAEFLGQKWHPGEIQESTLTKEIKSNGTRLINHYNRLIQGQGLPSYTASALLDYIKDIKPVPERAWFVDKVFRIFKPEGFLPLSLQASVELRYLSSMIQDDLADDSKERCGKPTLHCVLRPAQAIFLSEILAGIAVSELSDGIGEISLGPQKILEIFKEWANTHNRVNAGQFRDLFLEDTPLSDLRPIDSINLVEWTTGVEVGNCFYLGAIAGKASKEAVTDLKRCGVLFGLLMQLRDDFLDYSLDQKLLNKETLIDLRQGKKKLPLVLAYYYGDDKAKKRIDNAYSRNLIENDELLKLRKSIISSEAVAHLASIFEDLRKESLNILKEFGSVQAAIDLADFMNCYLSVK